MDRIRYIVFGYDGMCHEFEYHFKKFTDAVKAYKRLNRHSVTFVKCNDVLGGRAIHLPIF